MDMMNFRPINMDEFFRRPDPAAPVEPPPRPQYEPGYPLKVDCLVDARVHSQSSKEFVHNGLNWTIVWKIYLKEKSLYSACLTVSLMCPKDKAYFVKLIVKPENVLLGTLVQQIDATLFDCTRRSVTVRDAFTFAEARNPLAGDITNNDDPINPTVFNVKISIESVTEMANFSYHNQMWPGGTTWVSAGLNCAVRMKLKDLTDANPKFAKFRQDLRAELLSEKERNAFYDWAGAFFNRWFYGTPEYSKAIRNGIKFGFTRTYDRLDISDTDLDFVSRMGLPLYQHFGLEKNPTFDLRKGSAIRSVNQKSHFRLDMENPFRKFAVFNPQDVKTKMCQFYLYLEETPSGDVLMMGGATFDMKTNEDVYDQFIAILHVQIVIDNHVKIQHHCTRVIHPRQRTIAMVVDHMDAQYMAILQSDRIACMVQVTRTDTDLYHVPNYFHECVAVREAKKIAADEKVARREERQGRRDARAKNPSLDEVEDDSEDEEEPPKHLLMPGLIDGWLICRDDKRIGVNRTYLSAHAAYFNSKFFSTHFRDTGSNTVEVDEEEEIVWAALQIIYHRSFMLDPENYVDILVLGDRWLCKIIIEFVEMALLHTNIISAADKRELATAFRMDTINYILRHPEYAEDCDLKFPQGEARTEIEAASDEIDSGDRGRQLRKRGAEQMAQPSPTRRGRPAIEAARRALPIPEPRHVPALAPFIGPPRPQPAAARRRFNAAPIPEINLNRARGALRRMQMEFGIFARDIRIPVFQPRMRRVRGADEDDEEIIVID